MRPCKNALQGGPITGHARKNVPDGDLRERQSQHQRPFFFPLARPFGSDEGNAQHRSLGKLVQQRCLRSGL